MRWRITLVLAVLLAGCTAPPSADPTPVARNDGPLISGDLGGFDHRMLDEAQPTRNAGTARDVRDPDAPPVTLDGNASYALSVLIRETWSQRDGTTRERHPCGGLVVATPAGWPDPRAHLAAFRYEGNDTILDARGREWITERHVARANASARVWVQNVGGSSAFTADDGSHCAAPMYDHGPVNVLLHIEGVEQVDLWYFPPHRAGLEDPTVVPPTAPVANETA